LLGYASSAKDIKVILLNLINFAGQIYDATYYLILYIRMTRPEIIEVMTTYDYYYRLGVYFGIDFNSIFTATAPQIFE